MDSEDQTPNGDYSQAFDEFCKIINEVDDDKVMNEAQTRLEIINEILSRCLGWSKNKDIRVEERTEAGYSDYVLSTSRKAAVLEAKRKDKTFLLPSSKSPQIATIDSLVKSGDELSDAINQVIRYANNEGIPLAIVSNGVQFIAFMAFRGDGQRPLSGKAIVFSSFKQIKDNFVQFWNYFSRPGVIEKNLEQKLLESAAPRKGVKPSSVLDSYPGTRRRNTIQSSIQNLSELILEDLTHDELEKDFLKYCYCQSGALSQHSLLARDLIRNRYEQIDDETDVKIERISTRKGLSEDFLESSMSIRPIILMGDVGVGKSTFIRNLILAEDSVLNNDDIALHLDLGHDTILSSDIKTGCLASIRRALLDGYKIDISEDGLVRDIYKPELDRLKNGIYKNLEKDEFTKKEISELESLIENQAEHTKRTINHLVKERKSRLVIFLDNADQRSSDDQQEVFLIAHELASQSEAVVFVSIRPETFYASHKNGVLKAYHPKVFSIEPPRIDLVLQKRLEFGLKLTTGEIPVPGLDTNIKLINLSVMLRVMDRTLNSQHPSQKKLVAFIDNIAFGNVRTAVDMLKSFLGSGHINTQKILEIEEEEPESYLVPFHEFIKTIIYGNNNYYSPSDSMITNVYDSSTQDSKEYFLTLVILNELVFLKSSKLAPGFIDTGQLYTRLNSLGYTSDQIEKAIEACLKDELIESPVNSELGFSETETHLRVTPKGACYTNILASNFQYIDAMLVDIPVIEDVRLQNLVDTFRAGDLRIEERLNRTDEFMLYLGKAYSDNEKLNKDPRTSALINKIFEDYSSEAQFLRNKISQD